MKYEYPWLHYVVDNFYNYREFDAMVSELLELNPQANIYRDDELDKFPKTKKCIESKKLSVAYLKMFPTHREFGKLRINNELVIMRENKEFGIHDEIPEKILSAVTYVYPKCNKGTLLYNEEKKFVKEVEWQTNRTLFFCGITNKTWHSYQCDSNLRITINSFLVKI